MTNRKLAYIVKDQKPLVLGLNETVQHACRLMWERRSGSVLIVDSEERLRGIFTGRDAVRLLAKGSHVATTHLGQAMTPNPVTIALESRAIDALKAMNDGGFRHVPVTENGRISGIVSRGDFKGMEFDEFNWDGISKATGMTANREVASIIKDQQPLVLAANETVQQACQSMSESRSGSVLVVDEQQQLTGIFTGRDAVRLLANAKDAAEKSAACDEAISCDDYTGQPRHRRPASHERRRFPPSSRRREGKDLWCRFTPRLHGHRN